jgi:hypothetical protein
VSLLQPRRRSRVRMLARVALRRRSILLLLLLSCLLLCLLLCLLRLLCLLCLLLRQ